MAFAIVADQLESWRSRLEQNAVALESTVRWERGGTSFYFRDPDGSLPELATAESGRVTDSRFEPPVSSVSYAAGGASMS